jgi:hypothetical protein
MIVYFFTTAKDSHFLYPLMGTQADSICLLLWVEQQLSTGMQLFLLYANFDCSEYVHRRSIVGSYGSSIFSFLRTLHTDFYSGWTNYIPSNTVQVLLFPWILTSILFLMTTILIGMRQNLNVVLICISLIVKDVEHKSSFEKYLFS